MRNQTVIVLGAGIVGVSCALALRERGYEVTLIDRKAPGEETSFGNAGVIARSSCIPINNPALARALPTLLKNQSNSLRFSPGYLRRNLSWGMQFLWNARASQFARTCDALGALIDASMPIHKQWLAQTTQMHRLRDTGWMQLYRTQAAFDAAQGSRTLLRERAIAFDELTAEEILAREPHLSRNTFLRANHVTDAWSVDDPSAVVKAYATRFAALGGLFLQTEVTAAEQDSDGRWTVNKSTRAQHLVVALGPWSGGFLTGLNLATPLAYERGYHTHFVARAPINTPLYDVEAGYVVTPTPQGHRLTTGVELNALDAPSNYAQLQAVIPLAKAAMPLGNEIAGQIWRGARPTLPDSRPVIGASSKRAHLWLAFGHQHIGFSTGPATGRAIAALISNAPPPCELTPFDAARFRI